MYRQMHDNVIMIVVESFLSIALLGTIKYLFILFSMDMADVNEVLRFFLQLGIGAMTLIHLYRRTYPKNKPPKE